MHLKPLLYKLLVKNATTVYNMFFQTVNRRHFYTIKMFSGIQRKKKIKYATYTNIVNVKVVDVLCSRNPTYNIVCSKVWHVIRVPVLLTQPSRIAP